MKSLKAMTVLFLALAMITSQFSFAAVQNDGERKVVTILKQAEIIVGDENENVSEDKPLKREELMAILIQLAEPTLDGTFVLPSEPSFNDVPVSHWAYEIVEKAKYYNLSSGTGNGNFGLGLDVDYQQALTFITNFLGYPVSWENAISEAYGFGFYAVEPAQGSPFLRGHMFDLIVSMLNRKNLNTQSNWSEHILSKLSWDNVELINRNFSIKPFVNGSELSKLSWGPSKLATKDQLNYRFDNTELEWENASIDAIENMIFDMWLNTPIHGTRTFTFEYVAGLSAFEGKSSNIINRSIEYIVVEDVYLNATLTFNDMPVDVYLVTGHCNIGGFTQPIRMILQSMEGALINGWIDAITFTENLGPTENYMYFNN